ncbi:MAG: nucleotidyltransferase domain-containing protein [Deltaproteobacteria bacterium]|nr:nucleotidyltransferase domain-containing protein [Deltaproteobacteria bacterium]
MGISELVSGIVSKIVDACRPDKVIVFGSYITSSDQEPNDLDILVVMPSQLPRHKRAVPIRRLFRPAPCAMDILVYTPEEVAMWLGTANHIVTEAFENGEVVYEKE